MTPPVSLYITLQQHGYSVGSDSKEITCYGVMLYNSTKSIARTLFYNLVYSITLTKSSGKHSTVVRGT